jgi:hypothetical protein
VSDNSFGLTPVSGVLCQREAELVRCGVWESASGIKPGLELRGCKTLWCRCDCESELKMEIQA